MSLIKKGMDGQRGDWIKRGRWNTRKSSFECGGKVLINGNRNGWQLKLGHTIISINADLYISVTVYLHLNFFSVSFFRLLLCISAENRTKLKKIFYLNKRLKYFRKYTNCIWCFINTCIKRLFQMDSKQKRIWKER